MLDLQNIFKISITLKTKEYGGQNKCIQTSNIIEMI